MVVIKLLSLFFVWIVTSNCSSPNTKKITLEQAKECKSDEDCTIIYDEKCSLAHAGNNKFSDHYFEMLNERYKKMSCERIPTLKKFSAACINMKCTLEYK